MLLTDNELALRVIKHSVDGLVVIDKEGVVQFANPAAAAMFAGRTRELTGYHLGCPAGHEPVELTLAGGDSVIYVEMRSTSIDWEGHTATLAGLRDITDRKRAEEELQRQAKDLRDRNNELSSFNRAAVGREMRMIELKEEVNELCERLGEPPRHRIPRGESHAGVQQKAKA